MGSGKLHKVIEIFRQGRDLDGNDAEAVLDALIGETDETLMADVFRGWDAKGIAEDEIYLFAKILRSRMTRVRSRHDTFVDIVGTGGSRVKTFNVSTAAAFAVAGAGVPVAKHGNKAATSNSGSADVLSELGVDAAAPSEISERYLNEFGICFMFAPNHHRLSPTLAKVRRGLGFPTIFNCVGPLCNPASAQHQLIGVWNKELLPKMASALARLGTRRSWIVHGEDGLDEITISGGSFVAEVDGEEVKRIEIAPCDLGISSGETEILKTRTAAESAALVRAVLCGDNINTPAESIVLANSGAALYLSGRVKTLGDGTALAAESIRNGDAIKKMKQLSEAARK
ncbi:MAG TPA: anthranilate phosphoribosyltransferase [Pyrinomonadaceae bacterium]|nr:anthranilate phosphoribosyltransferase [Pyrinomonadaceae bacterium]